MSLCRDVLEVRGLLSLQGTGMLFLLLWTGVYV